MLHCFPYYLHNNVVIHITMIYHSVYMKVKAEKLSEKEVIQTLDTLYTAASAGQIGCQAFLA